MSKFKHQFGTQTKASGEGQRAALEQVRRIHYELGLKCHEDGLRWPCQTSRTVDAALAAAPVAEALTPLTGDVPAGVLEYDATSGEYTLTERLGPEEYGVAFLLFRAAAPAAEDCECGQPMEAHAGGLALLHHDEFMAVATPAPAPLTGEDEGIEADIRDFEYGVQPAPLTGEEP